MTLSVLTFNVQIPTVLFYIIQYKAWKGGFYINIMWTTGLLTEPSMGVLSFMWPGVTNKLHPCITI